MWRYVYAGKPKPFFHPICTPAGVCLTNFEPTDHLWHRGLWFTIKFINGENFWEERGPFGTQRTIGLPSISHDGDRIHLDTQLHWIRSDGVERVIREDRRMSYAPIDADSYAIDFETTLHADSDLTLDRTPFTTWGGYGGLVFRGTRQWVKSRVLLSTGQTTDRPIGAPAKWADLSGSLDGGPNLTGGFALLDHPSNVRHPTPIYGGADNYGNYLNAALLFHEPMTLARGAELSLRYRVCVHDGVWDLPRVSEAYEQYLATAKAPVAERQTLRT